MQACIASLLETPIEDVRPEVTSDTWHQDLTPWLAREFGLWPLVVDAVLPFYDGLVIAMGQGPRGLRHSVVWQDWGEGAGLVHDPHPDGTGLVDVPDRFLILAKWFPRSTT